MKPNQAIKLYPLLHEEIIAKGFGKGKVRSLKKKGKSRWPLLQDLANKNNTMLAAQTLHMFIEEEFWKETGKHCVFMEDKEQAINLIKAKFKIKHLIENLLPFESFMLCLPDDFEVNGLKPTGLLLSHVLIENLQTNQTRIFKKILPDDFTKNGDVTYPNINNDARHTFAITYRFESDGCKEEMVSIRIDESSLIGNLNDEFSFDSVGVSDDDRFENLSNTLIKLAFGLVVYLKVNPQSLQPGLPQKGKTKHLLTGMLWNKFEGCSSIGSLKDTHYRTWHIRQLVHDKYYQGEHSNKNKGDRFVFVSGSIVGDKVTEHTFTGTTR